MTTGLVSGGEEILPWTPDFVTYVDHVVILPYVEPASAELAEAAEAALRAGADAMALRNQGVITVGGTWRVALTRMILIEEAAKMQMAALTGGHPQPLSPAEVENIRQSPAVQYRRKILDTL